MQNLHLDTEIHIWRKCSCPWVSSHLVNYSWDLSQQLVLNRYLLILCCFCKRFNFKFICCYINYHTISSKSFILLLKPEILTGLVWKFSFRNGTLGLDPHVCKHFLNYLNLYEHSVPSFRICSKSWELSGSFLKYATSGEQYNKDF